jgi:ribosomal protein L24E
MLSRDNGRALYICILKEMKNIKMKRKKKRGKGGHTQSQTKTHQGKH